MNKNTLILLRGLPGSGKTFTADLLSNGEYPVLSADMYFEDTDGNYNFDASKLKDAHKWCLDRCEMFMQSSEYVIRDPYDKIFIANTFTQEWEMEAYFELAEKYGYNVVALIVENRHGSESIHNVPLETIDKMKNRFNIKL